MTRLRAKLIKLLAGKSTVVFNATIDGCLYSTENYPVIIKNTNIKTSYRIIKEPVTSTKNQRRKSKY